MVRKQQAQGKKRVRVLGDGAYIESISLNPLGNTCTFKWSNYDFNEVTIYKGVNNIKRKKPIRDGEASWSQHSEKSLLLLDLK